MSQNVCLRITNRWFNFQKFYEESKGSTSDAFFCEKVIQQLHTQEMFFDPQPTREIEIQPPNQCKTKGQLQIQEGCPSKR